MVFYSIAARLLDAGHVVLITPELGRHRRPDAGYPSHLTVRQVHVTEFHNVQIVFADGSKVTVPVDQIVKVAG